MNWNELLRVPSWTPLGRLCQGPIVEVGKDLYQIDQDQFVLAIPHDRNFEEARPDNPFVTLAYWAADVEAAKKCALLNEQQLARDITRPPSILLHGTNGTYGELMVSEFIRSVRNSAERAVYSGVTGNFIHKVIDTGEMRYCFLERDVQPDETPYAIEISLK